MLCEKCQRDVQAGQSYIFYYGNQTGKVRRGRQTITSYSIGGSQQPYLCNDCVFTFAMKERAGGFIGAGITFLIGAAIVGIIAFFWQDLTSAPIFWLAAALVLGYAISLILTSFVEKKRAENRDFDALSKTLQTDRGSKLAIALRKAGLESSGFKEFFTPGRMKELRISTPLKTG